MGTWGVSIFDDDLAMDIKAEFDDAIQNGLTVMEATGQVLVAFEDELEDEDEGPIIYLVLAVLQVALGDVQKDIRQKALEIIECEHGLDRWKDAGETELSERVRELNKLKGMLMK